MPVSATPDIQERYGRLLQVLARRREELRPLIAEAESVLRDRYLREIAAIEAAEARAAAGIYGICAGCMLPIDESRLDANPTALRCVACQTQYENAPARLAG